MAGRLSIGVLLLLAFAVAFAHPESFLRDPYDMVAYFGGSVPAGPDASWQGIFRWDVAPFKYRVLFHLIVDGLATVMDLVAPSVSALARYHAAVVWVSAATFLAAGFTLDRLLGELGFDLTERLVGLCAWIALPPVHQAYVYPTCTKEDFLGYALLFVGLIGMLRASPKLIVVAALLGATTRETLLILPGVVLLRGPGSWPFRIACLLLSVAVVVGIRGLLGLESYGALGQGWRYNLAHPVASLVGLFFLLGFTWVPVLALAWPRFRYALGDRLTPGQRRFLALFPFVALALLAAQLVLGRMTEIRISFLLSPWAIALLLLALRGLPLSSILSRRRAVGPLVLLAAVVLVEASGLARLLRQGANRHLAGFSGRSWWGVLYFQLAIGIYLGSCIASSSRGRPSSRAPAPAVEA